MRRHLALTTVVATAVACGPVVEDTDWMLGTFSNIADLSDAANIPDPIKIVFLPDGSGNYIKLGCEGNDTIGSFLWEAGDGLVRMSPPSDQERFIVPSSDSSPSTMTLNYRSGCSEVGRAEYPAEVGLHASEPDLVFEEAFYRTNPCLGTRPESNVECPPNTECDDPEPCSLYWCDEQEPTPCSP